MVKGVFFEAAAVMVAALVSVFYGLVGSRSNPSIHRKVRWMFLSPTAPSFPPENTHFLSFKAFCTVVLVHQSGTLAMVLRMTRPYLNGSIYWLRKKVPEDLRPIIGKTELKKSLHTRDPAEARIRFAKAIAEIEE